MKEIPILFSTIMVQANMDDRKEMTRRIINPQPIWCVDEDGNLYEGNHKGYVKVDGHPNWQHQFADEFSQIKKGDILYVREEHYRYGYWIEKEGEFTKTGKQKVMFIAITNEIRYYNDKPAEVLRRSKKDLFRPGWYKRLGRFMPKKVARIWLQVTDVRVERLRDITPWDVLAEGVGEKFKSGATSMTSASIDHITWSGSQLKLFAELWQKINGAESWQANPWVWVIKYKILSKTGRPETFPAYVKEAIR